MPALNTDLVRKTAPLFATEISGPITNSATTIPLDSVATLPTDTAVTLNLDETDVNGNPTPALREVVTGVVNVGASSLVSCLRGLDGTTAQAHLSGATVVQWWNANMVNDFMSAFLAQHSQQGAHVGLINTGGLANTGGLTTDSATITGNETVGGTLGVTGASTFVGAIGGAGYNMGTMFNPYKFSAYRSASQVIPGSTTTKVQFDTKYFDTHSDYDNTTNFRFVAPVAGFYWVTWAVGIQGTVTSAGPNSAVYKNGVFFQTGSAAVNGGTANNESVGGIPMQLAASDYLEIFIASGEAGNKNLANGAGNNHFSVFLISKT